MRIQELRILYIAVGVIVLIVAMLIYGELTQTSGEKYIREMTELSENIKVLLGEYKQEADRVVKELGMSGEVLSGEITLAPADYARIDARLQSYATNVGKNINDLADLADRWKFRDDVPEKFRVRHDNWIESIELVSDWLITYGKIGTYRDPKTKTYRTAPNPDFLRTIHRREIEGFISYLTAHPE